MIKRKLSEKGIIRMIVILVIALIVLGYFGFNVREIMDSDAVKNNLSFARELMHNVWKFYLEQPLTFIWENLIIKFVWQPILEAILKNPTHSF